jgi:hypothetical protein
MHSEEIVNVLNTLVKCPYSFTIEDPLDFVDFDTNIPLDSFRWLFSNELRFIRIIEKSSNNDRFISKRALFKWYYDLNLRLAQSRQFKLTNQYVAFAMSHLRREGRWNFPPPEIVEWGRSLGFICPSCTSSQYVFPLARILSYMSPIHPSPVSIKLTEIVLNDLSNEEIWQLPLGDVAEKLIEIGFSQFDRKVVRIVQARAGILKERYATLVQISKIYGLSRERIRQIERIFWHKLHSPSQRLKMPFIAAFLCDFMNESGRLLVDANPSKGSHRSFLAKCIFIPLTKLPKFKMIVLSDTKGIYSILKRILRKFSTQHYENIDIDYITNLLESESDIVLVNTDVKVIAERIMQLLRRRLNKAQKTYLALRTIGKPSHYSEIATVYNTLFPDSPLTENNIHAILSRELYGVVWIGVRGAFALKKWGYTHPSKTLFDTVTEIVKIIYKHTGRPVPFAVILAEVGKYRRVINPNSLFFATQRNPNLECISKDLFIPKCSKKQLRSMISTEKLDQILKEFSKKD